MPKSHTRTNFWLSAAQRPGTEGDQCEAEPARLCFALICCTARRTTTFTVSMLLTALPLLALNVKPSSPLNPRFGVYTTDAPDTDDRVPLVGFETMLYVNGRLLGSYAINVIVRGADVQNGTLPAVSFIETGQFSGRDEHPSNFDPGNPNGVQDHIDVQVGAKYAASLINALMTSTSWKDSVFFWTMDEGGGLFDHVPPMSVPSPDGIPPQDLKPNDPRGDFTITGFRVPNFIVSPFARKNFVSHTQMDYTAYLKFIETRWGLASLTARDAAMPDMTEFFDFKQAPWATAPSPPDQTTGGVCDFNRQ
jgi:phospholipase C